MQREHHSQRTEVSGIHTFGTSPSDGDERWICYTSRILDHWFVSFALNVVLYRFLDNKTLKLVQNFTD